MPDRESMGFVSVPRRGLLDEDLLLPWPVVWIAGTGDGTWPAPKYLVVANSRRADGQEHQSPMDTLAWVSERTLVPNANFAVFFPQVSVHPEPGDPASGADYDRLYGPYEKVLPAEVSR